MKILRLLFSFAPFTDWTATSVSLTPFKS